MEKRIYDKKTGIRYELQGDYYLPCLTLPEQPKVEIGIWGKRHLRYIKQHQKIRYTNDCIISIADFYMNYKLKSSSISFNILHQPKNKHVMDLSS